MNIQKTTGNINPKPAAQNPTQTAKPAASAVAKTPQSADPKATTQVAPRSVSSLISAAGLPADKLSASIISFARFFSLPLKPEILKSIRQQTFEAAPNASLPETTPAAEESEPQPSLTTDKWADEGSPLEPKSGIVFKNKEALSLAAAAAEGKGVELQPKGLETYAQAVDPDWRRRDSENGGKGGRRKREDGGKEEVPLQKTAALSAADLEKMALEGAGKDPLLAILNRLPEKDGKRWVVLPFDISDNGREFKVSLRILLETGKTADRADCMALDIAIRDVESGKNEKRQLFVLEPGHRLSVYLQEGNLRQTADKWSDEVEVQPEISKKEQAELTSELSSLLGIAPERIFIKTMTEAFPFEADFGNDLLRPIDEAV